MLFLFLAVGLAVDLGHLYVMKTELQNSADAAALAGATALTMPDDTKISTAVDRAVDVLNLNKHEFNHQEFVNGTDLSSLRSQVTFAVNLAGPYITEAEATAAPTNIRFIRVTTPNVPTPIAFTAFVLGSTYPVTAVATAGLSVPGNVSFCPAPLTAVDCPPDPNIPCQLPSENQGVCGPEGPAPNPDGSLCDPTRNFCKRCAYAIRAAPADGPAPGNYQILACAGNGANAVRMALAGGLYCQSCGTVSPGGGVGVPTQPGVEAGAVRQGINTRFDVYQGGNVNPYDFPPDPNIYEGVRTGTGNNETATGMTWTEYKAANPFLAPSHPSAPDRRILIIPITPYSEFDYANGKTTVTVHSLGAFFLQKKVGGGNDGVITAEYIGDEVIAAVGFDPNNAQTSNVVTVVLYK
jgi:Flp pilus assembly protein TadG